MSDSMAEVYFFTFISDFSRKTSESAINKMGFFTIRQLVIAVVRSLNQMRPKMVERRLKSLRRLFHSLPAEIWSMLKKSATLIASAPCQDLVDA